MRRWVKIATAVVLGGGLLVAGTWRPAFLAFVAWRWHRPVEVRGRLELHLFSRTPRIEAEDLILGNPPWTKAGTAASIARLTLQFAPLWGRRSGLMLLKVEGARLNLIRDEQARANWQRDDPRQSRGGSLPMILELKVPQAQISLADERLHLHYEGTLSIDGPDSDQPLRMEGSGMLNGHAVAFHLQGEALPQAAPGQPYAFEFDELSSGAHFSAHGSLPEAFDLGKLEARFSAEGADLRDLYFLAGVSLPNTGTFKAEGRISRRGDETRLEAIRAHSGESDVSGRIELSSPQGKRTQARVELVSTTLLLRDLGLKAAARDPNPDAPPTLFSDVRLVSAATRRSDVRGKFTAHRLKLSRIELAEVSAPFSIEDGHIRAPDATARLLGGRAEMDLAANAKEDPAAVQIKLKLDDIQLAQLPHKSDLTPYEGSLQARVQVHGRGNSLHALAAAADGRINARISQGSLRAALAELTGINLKGLGLALIRSDRQVAVSCAAADFDLHEGIMRPTRFIIESEPVAISGEGRILLGAERLDLKLRGTPKKLSILRLKAPVLVQGTLLEPKFKVDTEDSDLRLIDRGRESHEDCEAASGPDTANPERSALKLD